jgi:hypothetical protein
MFIYCDCISELHIHMERDIYEYFSHTKCFWETFDKLVKNAPYEYSQASVARTWTQWWHNQPGEITVSSQYYGPDISSNLLRHQFVDGNEYHVTQNAVYNGRGVVVARPLPISPAENAARYAGVDNLLATFNAATAQGWAPGQRPRGASRRRLASGRRDAALGFAPDDRSNQIRKAIEF